jgi:hypothetical protein
MTPRSRRQLAAPLVAIVTPWRLGRAIESGGRLPIVLAALAGLLVIPVIETTRTVITRFRLQDGLGQRFAPQPGLVTELVDSFVEHPEVPGATTAIRTLTWIAVWIMGELGSGLLTFAMLLGLLRLVTIRVGTDVKDIIVPGACAMTWWLGVATLAYTLFSYSMSADDPNLLRVGGALFAAWMMIGAGANAWSMLREFSRTRAVVGAIVLGLLITLVCMIGAQLTWQLVLPWHLQHMQLGR